MHETSRSRTLLDLVTPWLLCCVGLALAAPAHAVKTDTWRVGGVIDFGRAESTNVAITADGTARLAPRRELLYDPMQAYVWCLAEAPDGTIYAGTGDDGQILAIPPAGDPFVFYDSLELQILSIAVGPDGAVYAGGSPDGVILRIQDGVAGTYFDTPESYIWHLEFDDAGALFAATGDRGRLYRIPAAGQAEVYLDLDEVHLLSMVRRDATWMIGTSPNGLVLEVVAPDSALVRYDAAEEEIKALAVDPSGRVYVGAVGPPPGGSAPDTPSIDGYPMITSSQNEGRGAAIYRIENDGAVHEFWRANEGLVLSLETDGDQGLWVGTGERGTLVWLDARGTAIRLLEAAESQVLCLLATERAGLVIGTGNLAAVYRVGPTVETEGFITSEIFDARNVAAWGRVRWQGRTPPGTAVRLQTRTGNTQHPDATWSAWSSAYRDSRGEPVSSPAARYIQWRARLLGAGSESPLLESIDIAYLERNLPPRLHAIDIVAAEGDLMPVDYDRSPDRVLQTLPSGVQVEFAFPSSMSGPVRLDQVRWLRGTQVASWVADDPNGDHLMFDLYIRGEDERRWRMLAEEVLDQIYAFPTAEFEDGRYRLKIEATDRGSNPEGWALSDSIASRAFVVDNTAPTIHALRAQRRAEGDILVTCTVTDQQSVIRSMAYSVDTGVWREVFPEDTIYDALEESFRFVIDVADEAAEQTILVRVADDAANISARRVVVP